MPIELHWQSVVPATVRISCVDCLHILWQILSSVYKNLMDRTMMTSSSKSYQILKPLLFESKTNIYDMVDKRHAGELKLMQFLFSTKWHPIDKSL